ncbi:acyltransferase [Paenarthrobacter sp. DKR-5]|nr:acyltransferase [Paenarthrobacter sp. DKR-5]
MAVTSGRRLAQRKRAMTLRARGIDIADSVSIFGRMAVSRVPGSSITLRRGVVLNSAMTRNTLEARGPLVLKTISPGAGIEIGEDSGLTSVTISASSWITIGQRVLVGAGVLITDSDHHVVAADPVELRRHSGLPTPAARNRVVIEDDVFIGARAIVLKGVTIGRGSVIGAGSVVASNVPPGVIAAGNPCRVIATLKDFPV